ncbi:hypothetical protein Thermo_01297 [Thermoplasmatales archaeon]|nr:hypothetical protein Thermo_01297 [Thermoplasmatales archaeon]
MRKKNNINRIVLAIVVTTLVVGLSLAALIEVEGDAGNGTFGNPASTTYSHVESLTIGTYDLVGLLLYTTTLQEHWSTSQSGSVVSYENPPYWNVGTTPWWLFGSWTVSTGHGIVNNNNGTYYAYGDGSQDIGIGSFHLSGPFYSEIWFGIGGEFSFIHGSGTVS